MCECMSVYECVGMCILINIYLTMHAGIYLKYTVKIVVDVMTKSSMCVVRRY